MFIQCLCRISLIELRKNVTKSQIKSDVIFKRSITNFNVELSHEKKPMKLLSPKDGTRYRTRLREHTKDNLVNFQTIGQAKNICQTNKVLVPKRKKVAMVLGFSGTNYSGMQWNPDVKTIEGDLFKALWEARYITEDEYRNPKNKYWFQKSSRTDRNVSATRQVASLLWPIDGNIEEVNKRLPQTIRVFGTRRVAPSFNSHLSCTARTYSYTLPTYAFETNVVTNGDRRAYRMSTEKIELVNRVLSSYIGFKCYHNFTVKKFSTDPSTYRLMKNFSVDKLFVENDMQFAVLSVTGQSFMFHQIRKMVALVISIVRGYASMGIMEKAFGAERFPLPTVPGLGLVLEKIHFTVYDAKYKKSHPSLTWEEEDPDIEEFRRNYILPTIIKGEIEDDSMGIWLEKIPLHPFEGMGSIEGSSDSDNE